jgi:hypothetical protein
VSGGVSFSFNRLNLELHGPGHHISGDPALSGSRAGCVANLRRGIQVPYLSFGVIAFCRFFAALMCPERSSMLATGARRVAPRWIGVTHFLALELPMCRVQGSRCVTRTEQSSRE